MNISTALRKLLKIAGVLTLSCLVLVVAAAVWYVVEFYPRTAKPFTVNSPDQGTRILVATQGSEFKDGLVAAVCASLRERPVYVKVIDVNDLAAVDMAEWDRVLVVSTVMMDRMSGPVRRLVARGEGMDKTLLFITSGGADFKPADLEVDALSGASRMSDTVALAELIVEWAVADAAADWTARDQVLALQYFLQVDVDSACAAIAAERDDYRRRYFDLEGRLNRVGYDLVRRDRRREALLAFRLNRDLFPGSWNVYDSYAEALLASGDRAGAIANYRKSLELNPGREAGAELLAKLTGAG